MSTSFFLPFFDNFRFDWVESERAMILHVSTHCQVIHTAHGIGFKSSCLNDTACADASSLFFLTRVDFEEI